MFSLVKKVVALFAFLLVCALPIRAMDQKHTHEFHSIIMPGLNGGGGQTSRANNVVNTAPQNTTEYDILPAAQADLGQKNCVADFERQFNQNRTTLNRKYLLYGFSQGTATLTHWLAKKTHAQQNEATQLLVLEGVLGSGNSAIQHTVGYHAPFAPYLPFARLWLPWAAKAVALRGYNPLGTTTIELAKKLSPTLPVVIMHNQGDTELSINDAREYYCALREQGNNNAYLMEIDNGKAHCEVLSEYYREDGYPERHDKIRDLQAIYKKHGLPSKPQGNSYEPIDDHNSPFHFTQEYQPSVQEVRRRISKTTGYKNILRNTIDIMSGALILGGIWWKYFSKK